jgi:hypothetical protein
MHYKNGRPAKEGDKVLSLTNGQITVGILHSTNAQSTTCNGRLSVISPADPYVNLCDCLHIEDIAGAAIPNASCITADAAETEASRLYTAYCAAVGGKAFNGDPLPSWADFSNDPSKQVQADAWRSIGTMSLTRL